MTPAVPIADEPLEETVLVVPGMHCAGCMAKVERQLEAVPEVARARVNLSARQVRVDHHARVGTPELVAETETNRRRILSTDDSGGFVYPDADMAGSALRLELFDGMLLEGRLGLFGDYRQPTDWVEGS